MTYFPPWPNWKGEPISGATPFGGVTYVTELAVRMADALIEIACWFGGCHGKIYCMHCQQCLSSQCREWCPGLLARRALGVA